jgi:hypothetical protein
MNANEAKVKCNTISHKYPDATRKGWEARKTFAKECGIDVKVFNKGLSAQYDRFVGIIRGIKEINAYVPVDERSIKQLHPEQKKLLQIVTAYLAITKPKTKPVKHEPQWYAWWALNDGLEGMQTWAKDVIAKADKHVEDLKRKEQMKEYAQRRRAGS